MAVHQRHPSITALSAQQRVKQFKELFNSTSGGDTTRKSGKHRSNDSLTELKKRRLVNTAKKVSSSNKHKQEPRDRPASKPARPVPPVPPVPPIAAVGSMNYPMHSLMMHMVPQPIHCQALPAWLEVTDDDQANELFFQQQQEEQQQILEISATLTLSTSVGDVSTLSPPRHSTNPLDSTVFSLQQSITSPANINKCQSGNGNGKQSKLFNFEAEKAKTISNSSTDTNEKTETNPDLQCKPTSDEVDSDSQQSQSHSSPRNPTKAIGRFIITELKYDSSLTEDDMDGFEEEETATKEFEEKKEPKKRKKVKEWKPVSNASNAQKKKGHTESLILLRSKKLVNGGVKQFDGKKSEERAVEQNERSGHGEEMDEFDIDAEHRPLPTWLAEADDHREMQHISEESAVDRPFHQSEPTDVLN